MAGEDTTAENLIVACWQAWPPVYLILQEIEHMATERSKRPMVGVSVLVTKGNQVLLLKRQGSHGSGTWASPGGHLEYGETPEECGVRETLEEVGLEISELTFKAITNDIFASEGKHYIT